MTEIIRQLSDISARYDALFVDLWGCVHNGVVAYDDAVTALQAFRATGGKVVLVTNAPRPRDSVARQIAKLGVPDDAWDTIATSGDSARAAMYRGAVGRKVWFMGEDHDKSFFSPLHIVDNPVEIEQVPLEEAEGIVCCGPFDPHADIAVNRPELLYAKQKGLKLLCANPDIVVDRGDSREWCAGAVAKLYTEMGGESLYFGKPHPPIYDLARNRLAELGEAPSNSGILAIGDGPQTDISGAMGEDLDSLFISGGLASEETRTTTDPDPDALKAYLAKEGISPSFAIGYLR
ncbi:HAD-superfamily class IIA hydrolase, TIGR01459 [Roseivivax halotolerans]|jgi:HAD superfamily hydrolase (TIGR01459 family)|uniref:HAD-superfamily class IIA hydrolase, TIGR01459 n=1 Tax=Roseivivax halotolerans TaxID=93684 RepID=A0A1I5UXA9_9RHOB|nr:TIGR01459 family HAD-type hydrolase [Roseivivax halotolerans]SFP99964.1 HAD-superfamily class IIA hydrolase, TIGR01459 [Roseivivax halotolerans]